MRSTAVRGGGLRTTVLVIAFALWAGVVAGADADVPLTVEDLARRAELVVLGEVTSVASEFHATRRQIVTRVDIRVGETLKGQAGPNPLQLRQPGGRVGEMSSEIAGAPRFVAGERVLLFLVRAADGSLAVAGLFQGKFALERDAADRDVAVRRVPGSAEVLDRVSLEQVRATIAAAR
jgi:hypothetical protein